MFRVPRPRSSHTYKVQCTYQQQFDPALPVIKTDMAGLSAGTR